MAIHTTGALRPQVSATQNESAGLTLSNLALYAAATLLGGASLTLATTYGWARGADLASSAIWGATGLAVGLICLVAPRLMRTGPQAILAPLYALALMFALAAALGNASGGRQHVAAMVAADAATSARATEAYAAAKAALGKLPNARPAAVIETELSAILKDTRLNDCRGWLESAKLRTVCIQRVEPARAELATAIERARLDGMMRTADARLTDSTPRAPVSADAATLARYLAGIGLRVSADTVGDWLVILAVLVLEIGPGLALAAVGGRHHEQQSKASGNDSGNGETAATTNPVAPTQGPQVIDSGAESVESNAIADRLNQGPLVGRQRDLAEIFGLPVTTFRRRVESDPRLKLTATPTGSKLELVSA